MVQQSIQDWFTFTQDSSFSLDGNFSLVTSTGSVRDSNQDRVGVLRVSSSSRSFICACVCDGMGGMRDGDLAAAIGLAAFFSELIKSRRFYPIERLEHALQYANRQVAERCPGGGSTLSAALIENDDVYIANVGDSRIFGFSQSGELTRLTIDDTMFERYGSENRGLLQYLGLRKDLNPDVQKVSKDFVSILLASDGCYSIGESSIKSLQGSTPDALTFSRRAVQLSEWFGGHDNSSLVFISDVKKTIASLSNRSDVSIFSTQGRMQIEWVHEDPPSSRSQGDSRNDNLNLPKSQPSDVSPSDTDAKKVTRTKSRSAATKNSRTKGMAKKTSTESDQQFSIGFDGEGEE